MPNLKGKKVLLFTSKLFDYQEKIKKAIEQQGAIVHMYDERDNPSSVEKIILRKAKKILKRRYYKYYQMVAEREKDFSPDYVFFVSPEAIMPDSIEMLKSLYNKAKFILYMWDSVSNKHIKNVLKYFDYKLSFDPDDCNKYDMKFRPLFFTEEFREDPCNQKDYKYDFCFIGTVHSDRAKVLYEIKQYCDQEGLNYYFYLFVPGKLLLYLRKIFNRSFRKWDEKYISIKSISKEKVAYIQDNSRCIIDINHPNQTGLTMRTIEMVGMNRKLLTTNLNVKNYDFYRPENQILLDREKVEINRDELLANYVKIPDIIYEKYSIDTWVHDIFS